MRVLSVGGGSGGHVTPIVAVSNRLAGRVPDLEQRVWCDRKHVGQLKTMLHDSVRVDAIVSGKFRRYANLTLEQHLKYHIFRTHLRNLIDVFKILVGFVQSFFKLIAWRPDVVFCKGGFVCLPVGLAARLLRIPLVIHDSDTVPGLTNRILARFAKLIGTGAPVENYPNYPKNRTKYVGIPVRPEIRKFNESEKKQAKIELGFDGNQILILAIGGGGGASQLNQMIVKIAPKLIAKNCQILLLAGKGKADALKTNAESGQFQIVEFMSENLPAAIGAADIVVTRSGATAVAEFATVGAPIIIVPSPHLAGDHQTKNAKVYAQADAAIVIDQREVNTRPDMLFDAINELIDGPKRRQELGQNLAEFARPGALEKMTDMILEAAK